LPSDEPLYLTGIQSRVLLTIHELGVSLVSNESILKHAGISRSSWAVEQNRLIELGLVEKKSALSMSRDNVFRTVNYKLTERGSAITRDLLDISRILKSAAKPGQTSPFLRNVEPEFLLQIRECVEVAIEGYGVNFLQDVQSALSAKYQVSWGTIPDKLDLLMLVLKDFFGADGAKTVESMISSNIRARFSLRNEDCVDVRSSVENAHLKYALGKADNRSSASSSKNSASLATLKYNEPSSER